MSSVGFVMGSFFVCFGLNFSVVCSRFFLCLCGCQLSVVCAGVLCVFVVVISVFCVLAYFVCAWL